MPSSNKAVIAIDFSDCSHSLVNQALEVCGGDNVELILLHVASVPQNLDAETTVEFKGERLPALKLLTRSAHQRLEDYEQTLRARGLTVRSAIAEGEVATTLVDFSKEIGASLLVLGTRGRTGLGAALNPTIATRVTATSDCPVLTVKSKHHQGCDASSCVNCVSSQSPELVQLTAEMNG